MPAFICYALNRKLSVILCNYDRYRFFNAKRYQFSIDFLNRSGIIFFDDIRISARFTETDFSKTIALIISTACIRQIESDSSICAFNRKRCIVRTREIEIISLSGPLIAIQMFCSEKFNINCII